MIAAETIAGVIKTIREEVGLPIRRSLIDYRVTETTTIDEEEEGTEETRIVVDEVAVAGETTIVVAVAVVVMVVEDEETADEEGETRIVADEEIAEEEGEMRIVAEEEVEVTAETEGLEMSTKNRGQTTTLCPWAVVAVAEDAGKEDLPSDNDTTKVRDTAMDMFMTRNTGTTMDMVMVDTTDMEAAEDIFEADVAAGDMAAVDEAVEEDVGVVGLHQKAEKQLPLVPETTRALLPRRMPLIRLLLSRLRTAVAATEEEDVSVEEAVAEGALEEDPMLST
mmetsp:Transcript_11117/g.23009  ORF Transcript_11117/g.23009 Transcript_11117/m.23009 type:complete len:280 (-) Transcript_11117:869-1708(-)